MNIYYNINHIEKKLNSSSYYDYVLASQFFLPYTEEQKQNIMYVVQREIAKTLHQLYTKQPLLNG